MSEIEQCSKESKETRFMTSLQSRRLSIINLHL